MSRGVMKKNFCLGCGHPVLRPSYCSECSYKIAQIRKEVNAIIRQANLPPADGQTCVDCGKRAFHYDHRYYSRPLDVVPVCRVCNIRRGAARDLADVIRNGIGYNPGRSVEVDHLAEIPAAANLPASIQEAEKRAIRDALHKSKWNRTKAAKILGITFRSIRYKIKKYGLDAESDCH